MMQQPSFFSFSKPLQTIAGNHALEQLPGVFSSLNASRPLLISDRGIRDAGLTELVLSILFSRGKTAPAARFEDVPMDSDTKTIEQIARIFTGASCDSILALGGGSVINTAKGVNILVSSNSDSLSKHTGADSVQGPLKPLVAVPTTSGTGSEATLSAVIRERESGRDFTFASPALIPSAAILDPRMTITLPPYMTAVSGMDALAHAMEAYIGLGKNPFSDTAALQAVSLIRRYLPQVLEAPHNRTARLQMSLAAHLAGIALSNSMAGLVHSIGRCASALCGIPHGTCMSILLPHGLKYNQHRSDAPLRALLLPLAGREVYEKTPPEERSEEVIGQVQAFARKIHRLTNGALPLRFRDILTPEGRPVMSPHHIPVIAEHAIDDPFQFYSPEAVSPKELSHVILSAYWGYPLDTDLVKRGHQK